MTRLPSLMTWLPSFHCYLDNIHRVLGCLLNSFTPYSHCSVGNGIYKVTLRVSTAKGLLSLVYTAAVGGHPSSDAYLTPLAPLASPRHNKWTPVRCWSLVFLPAALLWCAERVQVKKVVILLITRLIATKRMQRFHRFFLLPWGSSVIALLLTFIISLLSSRAV